MSTSCIKRKRIIESENKIQHFAVYKLYSKIYTQILKIKCWVKATLMQMQIEKSKGLQLWYLEKRNVS